MKVVLKTPLYFKVVTGSTKTDRIFDTHDQASDYITMSAEGDWWYIERLHRQLITSYERKVYQLSIQETVERRSIVFDSRKQLGVPSSDPSS